MLTSVTLDYSHSFIQLSLTNTLQRILYFMSIILLTNLISLKVQIILQPEIITNFIMVPENMKTNYK